MDICITQEWSSLSSGSPFDDVTNQPIDVDVIREFEHLIENTSVLFSVF
jgi:hypothetical protein